MRGYLYVLINPSMMNLVKVGMTTRDVQKRCNELNSATGVATPFIVGFSEEVSDAPKAEKLVHDLLQSRGTRANPNREFFEISLNEAVKAINEITKLYPELLDLSQGDVADADTFGDEVKPEQSKQDIAFSQILDDLAQTASAGDVRNILNFLSENEPPFDNFDTACRKSKRRLELLVQEKYSPAIPLLYDVKLGLEDYTGIGELFEKASGIRMPLQVEQLPDQPIAQMIGKTLLLPNRASVPINAYEYLERHKVAGTAWLVNDLDRKISEIIYFASENRGRHFLDISFDEFDEFLKGSSASGSSIELDDFSQDAFEYLDIAIGFDVVRDLFANHSFTGSEPVLPEIDLTLLREYYQNLEECFKRIAPLAEMIASIVRTANLYMGYKAGHETDEKLRELMSDHMEKYHRAWELYGVQAFLEK